MPRPVFPIVRLPYDQPDQVTRILDTIRREFKASQRQQKIIAAPSAKTADIFHVIDRKKAYCRLNTAMTAQIHQKSQGHTKNIEVTEQMTATDSTDLTDTEVFVAQSVDQITVGVRECTLTPKPRPEILVTAGSTSIRNVYHNQQHFVSSTNSDYGNPFLIVPPVNITAEISRPPLTTRYTTAS